MDDSVLSPDIQRWLINAIGTGATIEWVRPLTGGISSSVYALDMRHDGRLWRLVLRLFTNAEWLADEPDLVEHEAAALIKIMGTRIRRPKLIAADPYGMGGGVPSVLMTRLPGAVVLRPDDFSAWLDGLAGALVPIHDIDPSDFGWDHFSYNNLSELQVPGWTRVPELWVKAIAIVNGPPPETPLRFIHRDYHPLNVLWRDGRVSGVVDWVNACRGPAGIDVGHCRLNLASLYGVDTADGFLRAYQAHGGAEQHPYWDLLTLVDWLPEPGVYAPWLELGMTHLTDALVRERLDDYLVSILARM